MRPFGKAVVLAGLLSGAILAGSACAPAKGTAVRTAPAPVDWPARLDLADGLCRSGHYLALREARDIYGQAMAAAVAAPGLAERCLRTSIALEMRRKDLGILSEGPGPNAGALVAADPSLARYKDWIELVEGLPKKIKGNAGIDQIAGRSLDRQLDWVAARVPDIDKGLAEPAATDDLAAALRLTLRREFGFKFEGKLDRAAIRDKFAASRLASFQAAVCPAVAAGELEILLREEPGFIEARYYLGDEALLAGRVLTAERHYLAVQEKIPESLSVLISLAKVAFQMEEIETCLEWNEKALALLPVYRDALLGQGLALGYLGRHDEALAALSRLLELGTYYLGEAHYWSAWNLSEIGRLDEARRAIDSARVFLVDVVDLHTLAGIIAYRQGRLDDAEKNLRRALDLHSSEAEAAYYLGRLYADRKDWLDSAIYFGGAAMSYEGKEKDLRERIAEIESSELAAERKARLIAKKRAQIAAAQLTMATCQYNGAAGYHNAGSFERALDLARQAAAHPAFAGKAAELIKIIQGR